MEAKPTRPNYQPYVPVHRRRQAEVVKEQQPSRPQQSEGTTEVKRRGRGQFRAPPSTTTVCFFFFFFLIYTTRPNLVTWPNSYRHTMKKHTMKRHILKRHVKKNTMKRR
jgi:hypothetical protein